jgi:hypothetical protein
MGLLGECKLVSTEYLFFLQGRVSIHTRSRHIVCYDEDTGDLTMSNMRSPGKDLSW